MNILYILILTFSLQNPLTGQTVVVQEQKAYLFEYRSDARRLIRDCESFDYKKPYKKCEAHLYEVDLDYLIIREDKRMRKYSE